MTRALIHGAGRMARMVLTRMPEFECYQLAGLVSRTKPDDLLAIDWFASLDGLQSKADLLIDFTLPGGTRSAAQWCASNNVAFLSGTTGLLTEDIETLKLAALKIPVLWAPNLSPGVALVKKLVAQAAATLGVEASIHITETHHVHKLDAPSGTALALAATAMEGRDKSPEHKLGSARQESPAKESENGESENGESEEGELSFTSLREGEVIGEHTVSFAVADELIEITHKALNREVFANGALKAGEWLVQQKAGFYTTSEWLGLDGQRPGTSSV